MALTRFVRNSLLQRDTCGLSTSYLYLGRPGITLIVSFDQVVFGIDVIASKKFGSAPIDLVVSGPNEGQNNGPFVFTLSGTVGATYVSVERGVGSPSSGCPT